MASLRFSYFICHFHFDLGANPALVTQAKLSLLVLHEYSSSSTSSSTHRPGAVLAAHSLASATPASHRWWTIPLEHLVSVRPASMDQLFARMLLVAAHRALRCLSHSAPCHKTMAPAAEAGCLRMWASHFTARWNHRSLQSPACRHKPRAALALRLE